MLRSWRVGKVFGIPLYVHSTFLLLPAWIIVATWGQGFFVTAFALSVVLATFFCVMLHELGHAFAGRAFGVATIDITMYPIGGLARLERMPELPAEEAVIALAGPAVNLVIGLLLAPLAIAAAFAGLTPGLGHGGSPSLEAGPLSVAAWFVCYLMFTNTGLLLFNLLPIFPMDGGRVFRALLAAPLGRRVATEIAAVVGFMLAIGVGLFYGVGPIFFGGTVNPLVILLVLFVIVVGRLELYMVRRESAPGPLVAVTPGAPAVRPINAPPAPGFTGFRWDQQYRVWVRWQDGRPVEVYGAE
jgi:Zn-dependent protease